MGTCWTISSYQERYLMFRAHSLPKKKRTNVACLPFLLTKDEKYGGMQPFRTYVGMKYQEGYSDHLPVYVDFETNQSEY